MTKDPLKAGGQECSAASGVQPKSGEKKRKPQNLTCLLSKPLEDQPHFCFGASISGFDLADDLAMGRVINEMRADY